MDALTLTDHEDDTLQVADTLDPEDGLLYLETEGGVYLDRANALRLYEHLGARLAETALDAEPADPTCTTAAHLHDHTTSACLGEWEQAPPALADGPEHVTILEDAQAAVYGDRQQDYGHPREDFTRTAIIWTGLLLPKLADGAHLEPEDVARCQIGVKLARDVHAPKRDNRVDMAGYALTLDRLETGR
jgi:hypothetical protein